MSLVFSIYNTDIDVKYIKSYPKSEKSFQFNDNDIIAATMNIVLDNTDPSVFSDLYTTGLFFGTDWYNQPVTIFDDELEIYTWTGRIKDIKENWNNKTVTVTSTNYFRDLADTVCNYTSTSSTTPAEHVYEILTDSDMLALTDDDIDYDGFQNAINIQSDAANTAYVDVRFTKKKNKKCLSVIKALCDIAHMHIYTDENNKIALYQWEAWNGILGFNVKEKDTISKTYKHWYDSKNIYNDVIVYHGAAIGTPYTTSDTTSKTTYGTKQWIKPDKNIDSLTGSNNNILYQNLKGATWAGDLTLTRFADPKKRFKLKLKDAYKFIDLADQLDLSFDPLVREPARVTKVMYDRNKQNVAIEGEYLNTPKSYYVRDTDPPVSPELVSLFPGDGFITAKWSLSTETDAVGYYAYLTATKGEWESEYCNLGRSPINIKNQSESPDLFAVQTFYELNNGTEYFLKVTAYDTSLNESTDSNILDAIPYDNGDLESFYMMQGDPYQAGLTLDVTNTLGGLPISGTLTYDDGTYDDSVYTYCANYDSIRHYNPDGWSTLSWKANGDTNDIRYQVRYSSDGSTWESWSSVTDAIGNKEIVLDSDYTFFQYRFIFYSDLWGDSDKVWVKEIS